MKMNLAVSMAIGNPYVGFRPIIPGINAPSLYTRPLVLPWLKSRYNLFLIF